MSDFKNGKWAKKLMDMQNEDGGWGCFHTLSAGAPTTTEQALRRLEALGFTEEDECIRKALALMDEYLGTGSFPNGNEKWKGWDIFCDRALATWICRFTDKNERANTVADRWAQIVTRGFESGEFDESAYAAAFEEEFGMKPNHGFEGISNFYPVSLLRGRLEVKTDGAVLDHLLSVDGGIYYICEGPLSAPPTEFQSRHANRYLYALELLAGYKTAREKLKFAVEWLESNRREDGTFDLGPAAKDQNYFPLSDRWDEKNRVADCTYRIEKLLAKLK